MHLCLQRMLPCHGNKDLFRHPPVTNVYCIRPYCPEDKVGLSHPKTPPSLLLSLLKVSLDFKDSFLTQMDLRRIFREMQNAENGKVPTMAQTPLICDW